jgi:hypothetical protein
MSKIISGEKKIELGTILLDGKVIMKDVIVITFPVGLGRSGFAPKYMVPKRARLSLTFVGDGGDRPIDLDIKAIGQIVTNSFGLPSHYSVNLKGTEVISNIECNI